MNDEQLAALIAREIKESSAYLLSKAEDNRKKAALLIQDADRAEKQANLQLNCKKHEFEHVPGTGMLGDRFEEKCKHCGWIHTC